MRRITVDEIFDEAAKVLDTEDTWPEKLARLEAASWPLEKIEKAKARHIAAVASQRELAQRVLAVNSETFRWPTSHGGDFYKPLLREAAASWFGFDIEIEWPIQTPAQR
ncbi:MAG: hypothetical protein FJ014_20120 [Chloroflexi bacterium]|nr:hypothetical protein [Chloroflexota bacterium]